MTQPHNRLSFRLSPRYVVRSQPRNPLLRYVQIVDRTILYLVCQIATVVVETTQLVLSQFKNIFFIIVNGELNKVSLRQNN